MFAALNPVEGDHVYVDAPLAVKCSFNPGHNVDGFAGEIDIVGKLYTFTVTDVLVAALHPVPLFCDSI